MNKPSLLSASDLHRVHTMAIQDSKWPPPTTEEKRKRIQSMRTMSMDTRSTREDAITSTAAVASAMSRSASGSKIKKGWKLPNKDSTAVGQAASVAAVALLLNRQVQSAETEPAGSCYHSEPERLSNYRNSVAYLDEEVEALLARRKQSTTAS